MHQHIAVCPSNYFFNLILFIIVICIQSFFFFFWSISLMASLMTVAALCQGNEMETVLLKGCLYESDLKDSLQFMHI